MLTCEMSFHIDYVVSPHALEDLEKRPGLKKWYHPIRNFFFRKRDRNEIRVWNNTYAKLLVVVTTIRGAEELEEGKGIEAGVAGTVCSFCPL